jgi:hypothetical protein
MFHPVLMSIPNNGDATWLLQYKEKEVGVLSIEELRHGSEWNITQVQGAKGSADILSRIEWQRCLAEHLLVCANLPQSDVCEIIMQTDFDLEDIYCAKKPENVFASLEIVRKALCMEFRLFPESCWGTVVTKNAHVQQKREPQILRLNDNSAIMSIHTPAPLSINENN